MPTQLLLLQEAAPFTPFSINTGLGFWTILIFLILLGLLWKMGWPAILKSVEDRERRIQQQLDEAERGRAEAARLLEEQKRALAGAKAQAQEIVTGAKAVAQKERDALLAKTHEEQERLLARARKDIESETQKARLALRREAVDLSLAAASKLVEANLDSDANRRLVLDYVASLGAAEKTR
jgi:F-type H+-transporting ATPase subunit b